jgi:P27 family predicted phage terminase small subunit
MSTVPSPPRTLDLSGRAEWRRLVPQLQGLGLLTGLDLSALEVYCALFAEERQLRKLRARGVREKRDDVWRVDTAIDRKRGLQRQFLSEFGLSPSSRTRLETEAPLLPPVPLPTGTDGRDPRRFFRD